MSKLKRQRLTVDGDDRVTAAGNDDIDGAGDDSQKNGQRTKRKIEQQRSLFVRSLPASATDESLTVLFSASYPLKHATVVLDPATRQSKGYGFVTFADVEDAQSAKEAFNGSLVDGKKIKVELARPRTRQGHGPDNIEPLDASAASPSVDGKQKPPRLIVRNLPWTVKDADQLSLLFRSFGKVKHASMPARGPGLSAGFGFVLLRGRKNAEKAMEALNGKEIEGRAIAVDWAVDKDTWENLQLETRKEASLQLQNGGTNGNSTESVNPEDDGFIAQDVVPPSKVDLSTISEEQEDEVQINENIEDDECEDGIEDEDEDEDEDEQEEEEEEEDHKDDKSSTLFVRNLPFTATDEALIEHFRQFGGVRYARVVLDQATDRSKGVGFVCFYNEQHANACINSAPRIQASTNQQQKGQGTANKQSLLQDNSLDRSGNYTLEGRVLQISRAVDRKEAIRLTFANKSLRDARDKDKRRLYLLAEGNVPSNSPLYNQLSPAEIKMREDSAKQRQSLVKTNPSLNLSLTRLSVRNLPRTIDSKALKALAREAAVGFAKDVKTGLRKPLTKEELSRGSDEMRDAEQARRSKGKGIVKQAKIVYEGREGTKIAEDSGAGRSRGYGFIEYSSHRWALMGLRWLNAHAVEPLKDSEGPSRERKKRLIVEFAIENAQVVMRRREKEAKARETSRIVQQKREKGEVLAQKEDPSRDQLMTTIPMSETKRKQSPSAKRNATFGKPDAKAEAAQGRLAKRQQIVGRKRMRRKNTGVQRT